MDSRWSRISVVNWRSLAIAPGLPCHVPYGDPSALFRLFFFLGPGNYERERTTYVYPVREYSECEIVKEWICELGESELLRGISRATMEAENCGSGFVE